MDIVKVSRGYLCFGAGREAGKIREEHGQALVEIALTFSIFLALLVGSAEIGMACYSANEVNNAALAGVEYGSQSAATSGDTMGIQTAATNDAPNITLGTTSVSHSCICSDGSASTCLATDCSTSHIETILTVTTQTTFDPGIHLPGLTIPFTLHGQAIQKVLQ